MAKPAIADEVQILRFFETSPVERAEVLFRIVAEKMRQRLHEEGNASGDGMPRQGATRRRQPRAASGEPGAPPPEPTSS